MKLAQLVFIHPRRDIRRFVGVAILVLVAVVLTVIARRWQSLAARGPESLFAPLDKETSKAKEPAWEYWCREVEETNSIGMKLVTIPAGEFLMGSPEKPRELLDWAKRMSPGYPYKLQWFAGETPQHQVRITQPFAMGVFEVTVGQFAKFVSATSYRTDAEKYNRGGTGWTGKKGNDEFVQHPKFSWRYAGFEQTDSHPVINVSWNDAVAFCAWLTKKEGRVYRLPTEAEWEYACRAGTTTRYNYGVDPEGLVRVGNVRDKTVHDRFDSWPHCLASPDGYVFTAAVGRFRPNEFGLYDMHGNAAEWCTDWYSEDYYAQSPLEDPQGPGAGSFRVIRGGSWTRRAVGCRSTSRRNGEPKDRNDQIGFRVVCAP